MNNEKKIVDPKTSDKVGFLVMTRRPGEGLMIGPDTHVIVTRMFNGQVRLAIYAPREVKISKTEMAGRQHG